MSGESLFHVRLVERLIAHVRTRHCPPRGLLVLADHYTYGANRPPNIGRYTPDLYASDLPVTFEVLGEAKTPSDLETPRSAAQIAAFLDHLSFRPRSSFYLSVPPFAKSRARAVLARLQQPAHESIHIEVIDGV
jgi:hypothetical protein